MSLSSFKESLRPCSSSSLSSSQNRPPSSPPSPLRRPPKSSLSQQLHRLDLPEFHRIPPPPTNLNQEKSSKTQKEEEEEEETEEERDAVPAVPPIPRASSTWQATGPFEPLLLSPPGVSPVVQVPASINCRLLEHQRAGVKFLYSLYKCNHGGVLGDDMGLGKTIQTIAFLAAVLGKDAEHGERLFDVENIHTENGPVLILCPTSVIQNWENEFSEWGDFSVALYHGPNRDMILEKVGCHGVEILITSFDTFRIHDSTLCDIPWGIVVVDEAHRLKNEKSQLYKSVLRIKTKKRFGLTGTIMQNKILELYNLFDWVSPGCLGDRKHFLEFYDEPIKHGQRLSAPERFVQVANERKQHLVAVLQKYLLRRTKEETIGHLMLGKEDNVVFCSMSEVQKRVYKRMLEQPDVQCLINKDLPCSCGSPLTQIECCRRTVPNGIIWSYLHRNNPQGCESCPFCLVLPCLIKLQQISNHLELIKPNHKDDIQKQRKDAELASAIFGTDIELVGGFDQTESFIGLSDVEHCGKMRALEKLLLSWTSHGDKILLFSYSVRMLDILEKFLIRRGYCFSRLDGATPMSCRQSLVDEFNRSPSKQVFLISTRAGGLGLNLVSANRVVVFDPNWNPAQDLQAQDRSFRYGQKRHVVVVRLLAAGSLEELVYSRQIYKQQLSNIAISGKIEKRYFEGVQDCKEFQGELFGICNLFRDLSDKPFTSEIVELHEKHKNPNTDASTVEETTESRKDLTKQSLLIGPNVLHCRSLQDTNEVPLASGPSGMTNKMQNGTKLDDLGIVYAHRNEDVVNMGIGLQQDVINPLGCEADERSINTTRNCLESGACMGRKILSKEKKLREYNRIAAYMDMGVLELSNWLLSASPSEVEELLLNYKRKKKKQKEDR